jgi:phenylpropionate dioxygenase-like ring-hydroxylating dioxygenase large terminal subunit
MQESDLAETAQPPAPKSRDPDRIMIPGLPKDQAVPTGMAPLIRNAWYVIAERSTVDRTLRSIKALGEPLVFFRTEAGEPVVLDDRCAHRRYALSKGVLIGDDVRCGYHGFTFNQTGRCIWVPGMKTALGFGVRAYPAVERGPWLWVWMGDPDKANPDLIPMEAAPRDDDCMFLTYCHNPGNYLLLIENLLDLSHIHFLHGPEAASIEQAEEPTKGMTVADGVGWTKDVPREKMGLIAHWCGGDPEMWISSSNWTKQHGPAFNHALSLRKALDSGVEAVPSSFYVAHAITPEDETNTHQFTLLCTSEKLVMPKEVLAQIVLENVFADDVYAIGRMQEAILSDRREGTVEYGVFNDRFGVTMRKQLDALKRLESEAGS